MPTQKKTFDLHVLTESALMIAMATVLSLIKLYEAPFGGAVTLLSMTPILILSLRRGCRTGVSAAFVYSVIQLLLGLANVGWVPSLSGKLLCVVFDYLLPFTVLGFGGMFRGVRLSKNGRTNVILQMLLGTLAVCLLRFACHIVSGAVIWYALDLEWYADEPGHIVNRYSKWLFSAVYNGWFMIPEILETAVGTPLIAAALTKGKSGSSGD